MSNPLVSIIVPVYNRGLSVGYCINSILNLDYDNFELIIVDDGSIDNTFSICQQYADQDKRIRLISKENEGVSVARNVGIAASQGEYITFVDSDDVVLPRHLDVILRNDSADLILTQRSNGRLIDGYVVFDNEKLESPDITIDNRDQIIEYLFGEYNPYVNPIYSCVDKFFLLSKIKDNGLKFNEDVSFGEDQIFVLDYLRYVDSFAFNRSITYLCMVYDFEVQHLGSRIRPYEDYMHCIMANFRAFERLLSRVESYHLELYSYDYLFDRLISRILFRFRDSPYKEMFPKKGLSLFITDEIKPILINYKHKFKCIQKPMIKAFTCIITCGSANLAILFYDLLLGLYRLRNKCTHR